MISSAWLPVSFFARPVLEVARGLLGMRLVRCLDGQRLAGTIVETEAYHGEDDLACHARAGRTKRTAVMYGPPGRAYVYFNYGMHWLLNCVTGDENIPSAVLLRAIRPTEGLEQISLHRAGQPASQWANGPAKLCKALSVDRSFNNHNLCLGDMLFIERGQTIPDEEVLTGPRVGIDSVDEPWRSIPWRFRIDPNFASKSDSAV